MPLKERWYHLFVLILASSNYSYVLRIIISYLKLYKWLLVFLYDDQTTSAVSEIWSISLLPWLPGSPWPRLVLPVWIPSIVQIELLNPLLTIIIIAYLKLFNCVQIIWIPSIVQIELLNPLLTIIIIAYLKLFNCVQIIWIPSIVQIELLNPLLTIIIIAY